MANIVRSDTKKKDDKGVGLQDLLIVKLSALYDVESQLTRALAKMAKAASDPELKQGFDKHRIQTEEHVRRLERIFEILEAKSHKLKGDAIRGLVHDTDWLTQEIKASPARDAALIAAGEAIEYYEMAQYEAAIAWARLLEQQEIIALLQETLREEEETSEELSRLASSRMNEEVLNAEARTIIV